MLRLSTFSVLLMIVLASGCPESVPPATPPDPRDDVEKRPDVDKQDLIPDDEATVSALQALGVKLGRNNQGQIDSVDASAIQGELTDEHAAMLSGLPALVSVNLDYSLVSNDGLAKLAEMPTIRSLSLRRCANVDDAGLTHLTRLPRLVHLKLLYNSNSITDAGMEPVGKITTLELLDLRGCTQIGDPGLAHLKELKNLKDFKLQCPPVTDEGVAHIAGMTKLKNLSLEKTRVTDEGLKSLQPLTQLEGLNLYSTPVSDDGMVHLKGMTKLKDVKLRDTATLGTGLVHLHPSKETLWRLDLSETFLTDEGLANLAPLTNLTSLNLWYTGVTDAGMKHLSELTKLNVLNLEECDVAAEGLAEVAKLTSLTKLNLTNTKVDDAALESLQALKQLENLDLANTQVSDEAIEAFNKAVPGCDVKR